MLHPVLKDSVHKIKDIIIEHHIPMKLFETGRDRDRHEMLLNKGKTKDLLSCHLYNLENDPPLYATAVDYVYFDSKWSWNLRDSTTNSWYILFGNLVLDDCPELEWSGLNRKSVNFCHFKLRKEEVISKLHKFPCVTSS